MAEVDDNDTIPQFHTSFNQLATDFNDFRVALRVEGRNVYLCLTDLLDRVTALETQNGALVTRVTALEKQRSSATSSTTSPMSSSPTPASAAPDAAATSSPKGVSGRDCKGASAPYCKDGIRKTSPSDMATHVCKHSHNFGITKANAVPPNRRGSGVLFSGQKCAGKCKDGKRKAVETVRIIVFADDARMDFKNCTVCGLPDRDPCLRGLPDNTMFDVRAWTDTDGEPPAMPGMASGASFVEPLTAPTSSTSSFADSAAVAAADDDRLEHESRAVRFNNDDNDDALMFSHWHTDVDDVFNMQYQMEDVAAFVPRARAAVTSAGEGSVDMVRHDALASEASDVGSIGVSLTASPRVKKRRHGNIGDETAAVLSTTVKGPGVWYIIMIENELRAVAELPADVTFYYIVDVARLHRWLPRIIHFDSIKHTIGSNVIPVAMHGWLDKFVIARCGVELACDFERARDMLMVGKLVLCAGRSDGWYELRFCDHVEGRIPLEIKGHFVIGRMRVFEESRRTMMRANGESEPLNLDEQRHGVSLPFFPAVPSDVGDDAVLLEILCMVTHWQAVHVGGEKRATIAGDATETTKTDVSTINSLQLIVQQLAAEAAKQRAEMAVLTAIEEANSKGSARVTASDEEVDDDHDGDDVDDNDGTQKAASSQPNRGANEKAQQVEHATTIDRCVADEVAGLDDLFVASEAGDVVRIDELLRDGVNPSADDNAAIRWAAANGRVTVVQRLLQDKRVDPSAKDNWASFRAAANGHVYVVNCLLRDLRVDPSRALIGYACGGHVDQVEWLLLNDRVDASAEDNDAIRLAAEHGHVAVIDALLRDKRIDPSAGFDYAIRWAAANGHATVVERLLQDARVSPAACDNCSIRWAAANGHCAVVELLLQDKRVDPSANKNYAIRRAARDGHIAVVERLLLDTRVDPNPMMRTFELLFNGLARHNCRSVLQIAAENGHVAVVERLLHDRRVDPSADSSIAIRKAARHGHVAVVDRLLRDKRVDLSQALIGYVSRGSLEQVEHILQHKCVDPSVQNWALSEAAENCHVAIVERLLQDNRTDPSHALRGYARGGHLEQVDRWLQDERVDPTVDNNSAICGAAANGHIAVVERLLHDERVYSSALNSDAIVQAAGNGHLAVVELLLRMDRSADHATASYCMAAAGGHIAVVERLLQDGNVDPSVENNVAISFAAMNGHIAVVERLLQDVRVDPSTHNNGLICWAAAGGHIAIVERLLQDVRVDASADNNAAIRSAAAGGHIAVVERLLQDVRVDPSADNNAAIRDAASDGHIAVVERLLRDKRVDPSFALTAARHEPHFERIAQLVARV
jgi:surface antigen